MPRELIDTGTDKRYVRRNKQGQFKDVVDVGKSLSQDRRRKAKRTVKAGDGDRGDQKPRKTSTRTGAKRTTTRATAAKKATPSRTKKKAPTRPRSKPKTISKARGRTKR